MLSSVPSSGSFVPGSPLSAWLGLGIGIGIGIGIGFIDRVRDRVRDSDSP